MKICATKRKCHSFLRYSSDIGQCCQPAHKTVLKSSFWAFCHLLSSICDLLSAYVTDRRQQMTEFQNFHRFWKISFGTFESHLIDYSKNQSFRLIKFLSKPRKLKAHQKIDNVFPVTGLSNTISLATNNGMWEMKMGISFHLWWQA